MTERPDALSAMTDLREVAAALERIPNPPPAVRRVLERLRRYECEAANGLTLEQALGLTVGRGQRPWYSIEAQRRRNAELALLVAERFGGLRITEQADRLATEARRYESSGWQIERDKPVDALPADTKRRRLHRALSVAGDRGLPGPRQLRNILGKP